MKVSLASPEHKVDPYPFYARLSTPACARSPGLPRSPAGPTDGLARHPLRRCGGGVQGRALRQKQAQRPDAGAGRAIFAQVNELEWGTPVLYMRAPDGRIFDVQELSEDDRRQARIGSLRREAGAAAAAEDWAAAANAWQSLLEIAPDDPEAKQGLRQGREQQEAAARKTQPPPEVRPAVPPPLPPSPPPLPPPGPGIQGELVPPSEPGAPQRPPRAIGDGLQVGALLPVGFSGWAIAAGYLGLLSLLGIFGPIALLTGLLAVRDIQRNPRKHGKARAIFGIVMGIFGTALIVLAELP